MTPPVFDTPGLAALLEHWSSSDLDRLDFAAIRVDAAGAVRALNGAAATLPGLHGKDAVGRSFYDEVAPTLANAEIRGRIERALRRGALDLELGHSSGIADPLHGVRGRMQPAAGGGFWLFLAAL
jgi:photoactive yellow protein